MEKSREEDRETKDRIFKEINDEIILVDEISHLANADTGFKQRVAELEQNSKQLK